LRRRKSLNLNPLELDDDNSFDESALEREPSMMETVDEDSPSRSQRGGKRLPVVSFFLGLYRVYVYQNIRSTLDLLRDEEQWAAIKDFFGLFVDHFVANGRSVRHDVFGLMMMAAYGPEEQFHGSHTCTTISAAGKEEWVVDNAYRAMRFSAAAYGWSMLNHMASVFNLNFMPTAQPEWKSILTPRSARTPGASDSPANSKDLETLSSENLSRHDSHREEHEEEDQANLSGETAIMSIVDDVSPEDILYSNFTSSARTFGKLPNHYIVMDHANDAVVVAFRGTLSLSEAITDVNCLPEPFSIGGEAGYAHKAMALGARMALKVLEDAILDISACYPEHRLWIVGHSLGAGVASLLAILLKEKHPKLPIECWAFGCPGVLSLNLARKVPQHFKNLGNIRENFDPPLSFMQCFSAGEDNIPRLSHGSILDLTSMADTLWEFFNSKMDAFYSAVLFSFRSRVSLIQWVVNSLVIVGISLAIGCMGYAAKFQHQMQRLFGLKRAPHCPEHLKKNMDLFSSQPEQSFVDSPGSSGKGLGRMPTLFKEIGKSLASGVMASDSDDDDDDDDDNQAVLLANLDQKLGLSRRDRLVRFSDVVNEKTTRQKRDKVVQRAAKKFLMAAHHEKLYPPAHAYQIRFDNHPLQYSLEMSKPEYFGWLLFSVGMLLHHFPRSYLYSLKTMQDDIRIKRMRAQERWSTIRRKSRLAIILTRFNMPRVTLTMVDKLEQYTNSLTSWIDSIERAGETDDVHLVSQKTMRSIKGHIKKRPGKNKNWKRAKIAIQLQKALMSMKQKQMGLEEELSHGYE